MLKQQKCLYHFQADKIVFNRMLKEHTHIKQQALGEFLGKQPCYARGVEIINARDH